jgi:hypothetical protein
MVFSKLVFLCFFVLNPPRFPFLFLDERLETTLTEVLGIEGLELAALAGLEELAELASLEALAVVAVLAVEATFALAKARFCERVILGKAGSAVTTALANLLASLALVAEAAAAAARSRILASLAAISAAEGTGTGSGRNVNKSEPFALRIYDIEPSL